MSDARRIVVVTPAHGEAASLPELYGRLAAALDGVAWRWLLVDDASGDACFAVAAALAASDPRVAAIRLTERSGAHPAVLAGLRVVAVDPGVDATVIMACDLQDPPEALPGLIAASLAGADVVWAVRQARPGTSLGRRAAARFVHALPRAMLGATFYPAGGADMGLVGRPVLDALQRLGPRPGNLFVRIARLRLPTGFVLVEKAARRSGESRWSALMLARLAVATWAEAIGFGWRAARPTAPSAILQATGWSDPSWTLDQGCFAAAAAQ